MVQSTRRSKVSNSVIVKEPKHNPWELFDVSEFKNVSEPIQIIEKLKALTQENLPFMGDLPTDEGLVSTDPLDSFMVAFIKIIGDRSLDFTSKVR